MTRRRSWAARVRSGRRRVTDDVDLRRWRAVGHSAVRNVNDAHSPPSPSFCERRRDEYAEEDHDDKDDDWTDYPGKYKKCLTDKKGKKNYAYQLLKPIADS